MITAREILTLWCYISVYRLTVISGSSVS